MPCFIEPMHPNLHVYRIGASAGYMCMQGIVSGATFVACILYVAYHHLSQYHGAWASAAALRSLTMGNCLCFCHYLHLHVKFARLSYMEPWLAWAVGLEWAPERGPGWSLSLYQASVVFYCLYSLLSWGFWHKRTSPMLCFAKVHGWPPRVNLACWGLLYVIECIKLN